MALNDIPDEIKEEMFSRGKQDLIDPRFSVNIFAYDAFQLQEDGTFTGYETQEDFINLIINDTANSTFNIFLRPTSVIETNPIKGLRLKSKEIYSQSEENAATWFFSKERIVFNVQTEIDLNNKLLFFSLESIYRIPDEIPENPALEPEIKNQTFYIIDSWNPDYEANGFTYGALTLKKVNSFVPQKQIDDGNGNKITVGVEFKFFRFNIQPVNVKRIKKVFTSRPVIFKNFFYNGAGLTVPYKLVGKSSANWFKQFFAWKRAGNGATFYPIYSQELSYWKTVAPPSGALIGIPGKANLTIQKIQGSTQQTVNENVSPFNTIYDDVFGGKYNNEKGIIDPKGNQGEGSLKSIPLVSSYYVAGASDKAIVTSFPRQDFVNLIKETVDFMLPNGYDLFGLQRNNNGQIGVSGNIVPREGDGNNAYWTNKKEELLYFLDLWGIEYKSQVFVTTEFGLWFSAPIINSTKYEYDDDDATETIIGDYVPYLVSDKRITDNGLLLQGELTWNGTAFNEIPPTSFSETLIDPNDNTWEYDTTKLNSCIGIFPDTIAEVARESNLNDINPTFLSTPELDLGSLSTEKYRWNYVSSKDFKIKTMPQQIFYQNEGKEIVIEYEFDEPIDKITLEQFNYFGGYRETVFYYENSYEDSLINGDELCKFTIELEGKEVELPLPPNEYVSINLKGNPLAAQENRYYGSASITQIQKAIRNKNLTSKKKYNIHTGKKVKL